MNHTGMTKVRVAIISPYFNRKEVVERTLVSIQKQTFQDFVAIVWDDFSSDGTWEELKSVRERLNDERFVIFQNTTNIGLTAGLNNAFSMTDAEYVAVVGSGDTCHFERITRQVEALDSNPEAVLCATNSTTVDEITGCEFADSKFNNTKITRCDLEEVVPFTHGSVMYRRQAVIDAGLYESVFKWCADWDLFLRILEVGDGVYLPEVYYRRYAMLDGVSFNPAKSMEQIEYKYLVRILAESTSEERERILIDARENLTDCVSVFSSQIARDLWKRQIKFIFMGRTSQADELGVLISRKWGYTTVQIVGLKAARLFMRLPMPVSKLINLARVFAKLWK